MKLLVLLLLPCLSLSELVKGFGECKKYFLKNDPPQFTALPGTALPQWVTTAQEICQCVWDENDQKKYLYATLYNTDWKIPIYSAYVFGSESVGRCDVWYIEPQLDDANGEPCMATKGRKTLTKQAMSSDYEKQDPNKPKYDRGHLYPVQHTYDHISMLATSTLTNAAPQESVFNRDQWKKHEKAVIDDLKDCKDKAYVVTGVVPDLNKPKVNKRVTVSEYYWRATCCLKSNVYTGKGYFGPNQNGVVEELSITALQTQLADYKVNIVIFPSLPSGYKRPLTGGCN